MVARNQGQKSPVRAETDSESTNTVRKWGHGIPDQRDTPRRYYLPASGEYRAE